MLDHESTTSQSQNSPTKIQKKTQQMTDLLIQDESDRVQTTRNKFEQVCDKRWSCGCFAPGGKKQQFRTTQCTRGSGHTRASDKQSAAAVTPAPQTGGAITPFLQIRPTEGREHQDEEDSSRKCCRRQETTHGTRGSNIIIVIRGAKSHQYTKTIEGMPSGPFNIAEQQTRNCFNWVTSLSAGQRKNSWSWWTF